MPSFPSIATLLRKRFAELHKEPRQVKYRLYILGFMKLSLFFHTHRLFFNASFFHFHVSCVFIPQRGAFRFFISILVDIVGVLLQHSSLFEASFALFWALTILIIYVITTLVTMSSFLFQSIADLLRSIPLHEGFGYLIQDLTSIVQIRFPNSSPLEGNSIRTWIFMISRSINRYNGDVISGSLTSAILISFLISCDETPIYVFLIWAIWVISYLKNNLAAIPSN